MQGVYIISKQLMRETNLFSSVICMIISIIGVGVFLFGIKIATDDFKSVKNRIKFRFIAAFICTILLAFESIILYSDYNTTWYHYKTVITEDVNFIEFIKHYEVISISDDGIFIIKERNTNVD